MDETSDAHYRVSAKALILDSNKRFLLSLENNGLWGFPGGGIDHGETPQECLKREIWEEMGIEILKVEDNPAYFLTTLGIKGKWKAAVIYVTEVKNLEFIKSEECQEIRFFSKEEAEKVKVYPSVSGFLKQFDPKKH